MATDTGSNYWLIGGGETPAPPTTLPPEIAALFGPVTRSGYAEAPVDPLSYYNPAPPPVETTPYTGAPTKWYEAYRRTPETPAPTPTPPPTPEIPVPVTPTTVTPDLSSVETFNPLPQEPVTPAEPEPAAPPTAYEQVAAEEPEVSVLPDWIKEYYVKYGTMPPYTPGTRGDSYIREDGAIVTPEGTANILPPGPSPTITLPPETVESTPAPQAQPPVFEERVTVTTPPKAPDFEFQEPAPARNPIVLPGTSILSRPVITTPLPDLPVNPVLTRNRETIPSRYFRDINYDPEEILAAAMRSMGGRMARRSILNELS